jgi:hypothetical protein
VCIYEHLRVGSEGVEGSVMNTIRFGSEGVEGVVVNTYMLGVKVWRV